MSFHSVRRDTFEQTKWTTQKWFDSLFFECALSRFASDTVREAKATVWGRVPGQLFLSQDWNGAHFTFVQTPANRFRGPPHAHLASVLILDVPT